MRADFGAHWNSRAKLDLTLGEAQLACALSFAQAGGSRCHRRAADDRRGSVCSMALTLTLRASAAWTPSGRGCELHVRSASKSPHSTLGVLDGLLLEALSCLREVCVGARRTDRRTAEVTSHVPLDLLK